MGWLLAIAVVAWLAFIVYACTRSEEERGPWDDWR